MRRHSRLSPATLDDDDGLTNMYVVPVRTYSNRPHWQSPRPVPDNNLTGYSIFSHCIRRTVSTNVTDIEEGMVPDEDKVRREITKRWTELSIVERLKWSKSTPRPWTHGDVIAI